MFRIFPIFLFIFASMLPQCGRATLLDSLLINLSEIPAEKTSENLDKKSILCNGIAIRYQELNEKNKARFYFLQSISFTEERIDLEQNWNDQNCYDLATLYRNMATFESTTGNKEQAILYLDKSEVYYKRLKALLTPEEYNEIMIDFYHSNFTLAYHLGEYEKGMSHLLRVEKMLLVSNVNSIHLAENYRFRAELYSATKDYKQAEIYAEKALKTYDRVSAEYPITKCVFERTVVTVKFRNKKFEELITFLNQREGYRTIDEAIETAGSDAVADLSNFVDNIFIRSFALMRLYEKTDDIELIKEADRWQKAAFQIAENYVVKNNVDKIGNVISDPANKVIGNLICMEYLKSHDLLGADKIIEALRMIDVQQSSRLQLERISYSVNQQLSQEEKRKKNELIYVNLKLEELAVQNENSVQRDSFTDIAFALSAEIQELNKQTKYDKILAEYLIGQNQFEELLNTYIENSNKNLVSYFYETNNDSIYVIGISQNMVYFEAVGVPDNVVTLITEAYQLNAHLQSDQTAIDRQKALNQELYSYLIGPILAHIDSKELLIYPNNELSYVSFDALMDADENYLVESFAIHYTTSLYSIISNENRPLLNASIASYYPSNYGTDTLAYLKNGKQEVNEIQRLLGGDSYREDLATKRSFLKEASQKQILHLASHSVLNMAHPYESYVLFEKTTDTTENRLFAHEIFSKTLNCEMVTLSSCNSAKGAIEQGIGVVSLANAFYFAGVPSTVSSLWSAQDKSSSEIMVDFYSNLKMGLNKSQSLQRAKIDYLESADKIKSQPFFWANYVVYGSDAPLFERSSSAPWWKYVLGVGLIVVLLILGRKLF